MNDKLPLPDHPSSWSITCGCGWHASSATRPGALLLAEHHQDHHAGHVVLVQGVPG